MLETAAPSDCGSGQTRATVPRLAQDEMWLARGECGRVRDAAGRSSGDCTDVCQVARTHRENPEIWFNCLENKGVFQETAQDWSSAPWALRLTGHAGLAALALPTFPRRLVTAPMLQCGNGHRNRDQPGLPGRRREPESSCTHTSEFMHQFTRIRVCPVV